MCIGGVQAILAFNSFAHSKQLPLYYIQMQKCIYKIADFQ